AAGSPNVPAVVTVARHEGRAIACVHAVSLSPDRWRTLLDALGLDAAGWAAPRPDPAPHEQALRRALQAQGRWVDEPLGCPAPPPDAVIERALGGCRRRASARHGMALVDDQGLHCFVGGQWRAM